ncbi:MAG: leucine--tRNA ligase [Patescibacteria group bacterium]
MEIINNNRIKNMPNEEKNEKVLKVEKKWQERWEKARLYEPDLDKAEKPFYNLMMFPYPSAEGLHVGNVYAFTGADIYGRFQRLQGNDVFEPMGFDAFGIHSENYARKIGKTPKETVEKNIKNFRKQLNQLGMMFDWSREVNTTLPEYYKWNQWLFLQLFKNGLAYKKEAPVNWCPSCETVVADAMAIDNKCERCGAEITQKKLSQWFFKITDYAERLLEDHKKIDWSERTIKAQREWIGKSEGTLITFNLKSKKSNLKNIEVFTTRPDTLFGATYVVLAPENQLIEKLKSEIKNFDKIKEYAEKSAKKTKEERIKENDEKTGIELKGIKAVNPATGKEIPIWISDYVLAEYGTGAVMAVPAHDQRDFEFAKKFNLPIKQVICPNWPEKICPILEKAYEGEGNLVDSNEFSGIHSLDAVKKITEWLEKENIGKKEIKYHLRDWLISRQRYWATPIPVIYCDRCPKILISKSEIRNKSEIQNLPVRQAGPKFQTTIIDGKEYTIIPVPEKDLPIKLPFQKDSSVATKGKSPLAAIESFVNTVCPDCGGKAVRETDTMDNFIDSAWYYFRYVSTEFNDKPFDKARIKKWLPVNMYIGGNEHANLHLLYTRFITKVLHNLGYIDFDEPFKKFRAHGLLIKEGAKISKSKGNIINPDDYIDRYGADTLRMYLMFLGRYEEGGDFQDKGIVGIERFLNRVHDLVEIFLKQKITPTDKNSPVLKERHKTIKKVTEDIENLQFNTAISSLMEFANAAQAKPRTESFQPNILIPHQKIETFWCGEKNIAKEDIEALLILLAPFAPHLTEELWSQIYPEKYEKNAKYSVHKEKWPEYDIELTKEKTFDMVIQINGKMRGIFNAEIGISEDAAKKIALQDNKIQSCIAGKNIKKIIFIKDKLINIVI